MKCHHDAKVIIISLKGSKSRGIISRQLIKQQVSYSFFDAIKPESVNMTGFNNYLAEKKYQRKLKTGEVGCTLSHKKVMEEFLISNKSNGSWLVVLEDDALLESSFHSLVQNLERENKKSPSVYLLGHSKTRKKDLWLQRAKQPLKEIHNFSGCEFGRNDRINFCGTVGYIININGAKLLANQSEAFYLADDWVYQKNNGLEIYHPVYPLIYEDLESESSIGNTVFFNHDFWRSPFIQILSVLKAQIYNIFRF